MAAGLHAGAAAGGGPGVSVGLEVGLLLDSTGLSAYVPSTKNPTHCGANTTCSDAVGATAGVGVAAHFIVDASAAEGDGRSATMETPYGSGRVSSSPDGSLTSVDVGMGPSAGAAAHIDQVHTDYDRLF